MDLVLDAADRHLLTPYVYPTSWPEGEPCRQLLSLFVITNLGALALYLLFGTLSYYFIFDHELQKHPQFLEVGAPHPTPPHRYPTSPGTCHVPLASLSPSSGWRLFQMTHANTVLSPLPICYLLSCLKGYFSPTYQPLPCTPLMKHTHTPPPTPDHQTEPLETPGKHEDTAQSLPLTH